MREGFIIIFNSRRSIVEKKEQNAGFEKLETWQ